MSNTVRKIFVVDSDGRGGSLADIIARRLNERYGDSVSFECKGIVPFFKDNNIITIHDVQEADLIFATGFKQHAFLFGFVKGALEALSTDGEFQARARTITAPAIVDLKISYPWNKNATNAYATIDLVVAQTLKERFGISLVQDDPHADNAYSFLL